MWAIVLAMATMLGAFGGFPEPPKLCLWFAQYPIVQWALVWILIYQGGSGQNPVTTTALTAVTYLLYQLIRYFEKKDPKEKEKVHIDFADTFTLNPTVDAKLMAEKEKEEKEENSEDGTMF